ncbi:MAG: response regulator [Muribaculaceae bacterium]|nr:response regulator [Muribaculaceae bacterium]
MAVAVVLSLLWSCGKSTAPHCHDDHYQQVDSILKPITDLDTLSAMLNNYHDAKDRVGEMIACRYYGRVLRNNSRFDEAMVVHRRGMDLASECADTIEMIAALNNLGTDCRRLGDMSVANGFHYKALKLCDTYSDQDSREALESRVTTLNGIGNIDQELCNYTSADSVFRRALQGEIQLGRPVGMAINCANLGDVMFALGEIDSAWVYYRKSMEYNQQAGNQMGVGLCRLHFGMLHEHDRSFSHAQDEYKQAYDILKNQGDTWHWLDACLALASVSIKLGEEDVARQCVEEAELESKRINSKKHQVDVSMVRYELALRDNDPQQALQHYINADELRDSIYGLKKSDEMRSQRVEYQRDRQLGEMDVLNRDINHQKRMRNVQIVFMLLLLLMSAAIIGTLVYAVRTRTRTQRLMRQVEETRSLFFTNVVHQLRTPLTGIMGAIDGIMADTDGSHEYLPGVIENAEIIKRQGNNLLVLVDRILEVGGVRSAIKSPEWRTGDVVTLMHMVIESYRERCVERHIELTYLSREASVEVDVVQHYLVTIVGCLLENAINYSRDFSKITVISSVDDGMFTIRVADTGMGISKSDLPHVFEPFYRGAAAEQLVEGVGIGLTVVRDMAMAMGGSVAADSMKGQGSVFTVKLPCRHDEGVKKRFEQMIAPVINLSSAQRHGPSELPDIALNDKPGCPVVLVVEDHVDVAKLVGQLLGKTYSVRYATNGEQGLSLSHEIVPDLIITDVKMPIKDGCELCRDIRQSSQLQHIPVIMLSARNSEADRIRGIEAGADAYLVKPFVPEELLAWVKNLIERRKTLREAHADVLMQPRDAKGAAVTDKVAVQRFLEAFAREVDECLSTGAKLDIDRIALSFKMGESQLRRRIQELTGKSLTAHVAQLRMNKAMSLLRSNKDLLIGEVAERCGFTDVAYFSRVFRQHYGMTPTQARSMTGDEQG